VFEWGREGVSHFYEYFNKRQSNISVRVQYIMSTDISGADVAMREEVKEEEEELFRVATDHRTAPRVLPRLVVAADCFVTFADDGNVDAVLDDGSARGASSVTLCVTPAAASRRFCPQ